MLQNLQMTARDAQNETSYRVDHICHELNQTPGRDVAYHASHALHSLHTHATRRERSITAAQAQMIRSAIEAASPYLLALFPERMACSTAALALANAKTLAGYWAQDPADGAALDRGAAQNAGRYVLWLRNCCHNLSLLHEIDEFHVCRIREFRRARQTIANG